MLKYYTDDITWCSNLRCETKCERHITQIRPTFHKEYSFADLEGTEFCTKCKESEVK